jgi:starch phosphorylase
MSLSLSDRIRRHIGRDPQQAARHDVFRALAEWVREALLERWVATECAWDEAQGREVAYLSMEFHVGRLLMTSILALDMEVEVRAALQPFGVSLSELEEEEAGARVGSGGLGRLAACFLDSMAGLDLPGRGYGLRFELGLFKQTIVDGEQIERPDPWLDRNGWPWERAREEEAVDVGFGGHVEFHHEGDHLQCEWRPAQVVRAIPYDIPVAGYGTNTVGTLRLWRAEAPEVPELDAFLTGDYSGAWSADSRARALTTYLYPPDGTREGRELRLCQQHFLASASVADLLRRYGSPQELHRRCVAQLNDTHPVLAIPELMRLLLDVHRLAWEEAWTITKDVFAYTNHTLLPEALETWPLDLFTAVLPRHMQLIEEIDRRHQEEVRRRFVGDTERVQRMAIVAPGEDRLHMAHLAVVGSSHINGVAALHTRLMRGGLFRDFDEQTPERFSSKTNGVTPRRWLVQANPGLTALLREAVGTGWERDLNALRALEPHAEDASFCEAFERVKLENKRSLSTWCAAEYGLPFDPQALLDVQVKRFHEYKRQLLLTLWVVHRAIELERGEADDAPSRTVLFGGKAAATYDAAKRIIRVIHAVAAGLQRNPATRDRLRVVFVPDYKVAVAQRIVTAAELSEQISTAGYEASGTGNMKLSLNGALTVGTLDGANVEILEEVGAEHMVCFGLDPEGVRRVQQEGPGPRERYESDPALREVLDAVSGYERFSPGFPELVRELLNDDPYCVLADFPAYCAAQEQVDARYLDPAGWNRSAVITTARMGRFSSDRTIQEYADEVWRLKPVSV